MLAAETLRTIPEPAAGAIGNGAAGDQSLLFEPAQTVMTTPGNLPDEPADER